MFKIRIIRLKDIVKVLLILLLIYVLFVFIKSRIDFKYIISHRFKIDITKYLTVAINTESDVIHNIYSKNDNQKSIGKISSDIIYKNTSSIFKTNEYINKNIGQDNEENEEEQGNIELSENQENNFIEGEKMIDKSSFTNVDTEVVTQNPILESYNFEYNGVKIRNETSFEMTENILDYSNLQINTNNILVFHTHTCESYTQTENYSYNPSGNYRTVDLNYSVSRVGDELISYLNGFGFNTYHDKTYHDYPAYTGSYSRSLKTVNNILQSFKSDIIIDLHRDAIGSNENYAPTVKIGEDYCAQVMFVIGTNGGGLYHPNWNNNLKFAIKIQQKANEMYPGLFKPIIVRNSRYNQHLGKAACIIEVGATGNTLEQTLSSMKYVSNVFNEALK